MSRRIVSLLPAATEIVAALGCESQLVGRSHECDHPENVRQLPVCSEPAIDVQGGSRDVHERFAAASQDALSIYRVDGDRVRELRPDVILTQTQCEACAVSLSDVEAAVARSLQGPCEVVSLEPHAMGDIWEDIRLVASALGIAERGESLVERLQRRLADLVVRSERLARKPTVICIEWIDPLMAAGNWVPELVGMAGGINAFGSAGEHSPWLSWDELVAADPDVIVAMPCGWNQALARTELTVLTSRPQWHRLRAVRAGRVAVADGSQFFNRPGPRLVESAEILAEILHPETFHFGHRHVNWEPLV